METKPPANTRSFYEPEHLRKLVLDNAKNAFQEKLNKIESPHFTLRVSKIDYPDPDKHFTITDQKNAVLNRTSLTVPLRAQFELVKKDTNEVVATKNTVVAHVPWITNRNTALISGSEYIPNNQFRLLPGVYTRKKETGEIEAHLNVLPGTGVGGHIIFYPEKQLFMYKIQNTQIPLYGVLRDLGVSDSAISVAWGNEIYLKNKAGYTGNEIDKLYDKIFTK